MLLKLAWKNIWRNKKRTIIVSISIFFAVFLSSVMRSGQIGSFDYMIHSLAHMHLGYMQIQHPDFFENRSLDNSINNDFNRAELIRMGKNITGSSYRLETFALLSSDTLTRIAQIVGIEPEYETQVTALQDKIITGRYLKSADKGILLGDALAKNLGVGLGDTLVLFGSGYHGMSAAALLKVAGILHFPISNMNKMMLYMDIKHAQFIFSMPAMATSLVINLDKIDYLPEVVERISAITGQDESILTWEELMPEIKQTITMKYGSNYIMIGLLYMVIGFGIFGVIMMMTMEREKEYGILFGIGMKKATLIAISVLESFMVVSLGIIAGLGFSIPVLSFLADNPIPLTGDVAKSWEQIGIEPVLTFSNNADIFIYQALIVFIIALVCAIYPVVFLAKFKLIDALKK